MGDGSTFDVGTTFGGVGAEAEMARHLDREAARAERKLVREARPKQEKGGLTASQKRLLERKGVAKTSSQKRIEARAVKKGDEKAAEALPAPKIVVQPIADPLQFVGKPEQLGALPPAPAGAEEPPLPLEGRPEAGNPNMRDFATRLDRLEFSVIQARAMPEEIMNIIPVQTGVGANDPVLKLSMGTNGNNAAYWGPITTNMTEDVKVGIVDGSAAGFIGANDDDGVLRTDSSITYDAHSDGAGGFDYITLSVTDTNQDEKVAVTGATVPGYLGATAGDGVLRTDGTILYAAPGNFVTLSVVASNLVGGPWEAFTTNHTELTFTGSGTIGTGESGGNTDHDDAYWHTRNDGVGGAHANYTNGNDYATTGTVFATNIDADDIDADGIDVGTLTWTTAITGPSFNNWSAADFTANASSTATIAAPTLTIDAGTTLNVGSGPPNVAQTIADGGNNLFEQGFFVNDGAWVITNVNVLVAGGTTQSMTVLAKMP